MRLRSVLRSRIIVLCVLLGVAGCSDDPPPAPRARVVFSSTEINEQLPLPPQQTTFSLSTLVNLEVYTFLENVSAGDHTELLKFFTPGGQLYYNELILFTLGGPSTASLQSLKKHTGIPHNRAVLVAEVTPNGIGVEMTLPVAGTWITQNSLTGSWRVEVFLDGNPTPIGTGQFTLTQ